MDTVRPERVVEAVARARTILGAELGDAAGLSLAELGLRDISGPTRPRNDSLIFLSASSPEYAGALAKVSGCLVIAPLGFEAGDLLKRHAVILARKPKYAFALIGNELFPVRSWRGKLEREIGPSAYAAEDIHIDDDVVIEPFVTIGRGSRIGRGCVIMRGASIGPFVEIGEDCLIKENAVIGALGFGFAFDGERPPVRMPHFGGVRIGNRVEIGAQTVVGIGTMDPTVIEDDVKVADHVQVGHNTRTGAGSVVCTHSVISGSTQLGRRCWIAPGVTLRNKIRLGDGVTAGLGSVVVKNVAPGTTVLGVPAKPLEGATTPWYLTEDGTP